MVVAQVKIPKDPAKVPASKVGTDPKAKVSPTASPSRSSDDELLALRVRNKVLTEALAAIKESASDEMMRRYDLVWFAKYRYRYPNHKESKRIDQQHKAEIEKLRSEDGDFHHGFNTGLLAAARMFKDKADVAHINKFEELTPGLLAEASKHRQRIQEARGSFPQTEVTNDFPKQEN